MLKRVICITLIMVLFSQFFVEPAAFALDSTDAAVHADIVITVVVMVVALFVGVLVKAAKTEEQKEEKADGRAKLGPHEVSIRRQNGETVVTAKVLRVEF